MLFRSRRGDDAAMAAADGHRPTSEPGIVALLDGGVESIHVDMDDLANGCRVARFVHGLFLTETLVI